MAKMSMRESGYTPVAGSKGARYISPNGENVSRRRALTAVRGMSVESYTALHKVNPGLQRLAENLSKLNNQKIQSFIRSQEWGDIVGRLKYGDKEVRWQLLHNLARSGNALTPEELESLYKMINEEDGEEEEEEDE